jgi:VanZ family protein
MEMHVCIKWFTLKTMNTSVSAPPAVSYFARVSLLVFTLLIVYASWYPFSEWQNIGLHPLGYLFAKFPYYWTVFDVWTNVAGYMPFGMLVVFALYPTIRSYWALLIAILAGTLLSGTMEAVQTYLPTRVPSNLDLITNVLGTTLGAAIGLKCVPYFLEGSQFLNLRKHWFLPEASRGLVVISLWPLALIYPQNHLFGLGHFVPLLTDLLSGLLESPLHLATLWANTMQLSPETYWLTDTFITTCGVTGATLTLFLILTNHAPKGIFALLFILCLLAVKTLASALMFEPHNALVWITPGTLGGILLSLPVIFGLSFAPRKAQRRIAVIALSAGLLLTNIIPDNPYFVEMLQTWSRGKFLNFSGAAQFLAILLPFLALWYLYHPVHRHKASH